MARTITACRHHWLIEAPSGPTSRGRCRRCGEEREFTNSHGDGWLVPSKADAILIARVKREEAAVGRVIHDFCQDGYLPLTAYRRDAQREGVL